MEEIPVNVRMTIRIRKNCLPGKPTPALKTDCNYPSAAAFDPDRTRAFGDASHRKNRIFPGWDTGGFGKSYFLPADQIYLE